MPKGARIASDVKHILLGITAGLALSGCQTTSLQPPCQLPGSTQTLGMQTWQKPGTKIYTDSQSCLARGGTWTQINHEEQISQWAYLAGQGDSAAALKLGQHSLNQTPPHYTQARDWFIASFELGNSAGAWHLGHMAQHGMGQTPDRLVALNWFQRAAQGRVLVERQRLDDQHRINANLRSSLNHAHGELAQKTARLETTESQLQRLQSRPKTPLYRFDFDQTGSCGVALDWQVFGDNVSGLALALEQFDQQFQGQGWLWLHGGDSLPWLNEPLAQSVLQDYLVTRNHPVIVTDAWSQWVQAQPYGLPLVINQSPSETVDWQGTRIEFDCAL